VYVMKRESSNSPFPSYGKASKLLEDMTISHPQLAANYRKVSLNLPVVDGMITLDLSSVNPIDHVINIVMSLI
jgi:hypothetical protein